MVMVLWAEVEAEGSMVLWEEKLRSVAETALFGRQSE